jgi:hypothetical protein
MAPASRGGSESQVNEVNDVEIDAEKVWVYTPSWLWRNAAQGTGRRPAEEKGAYETKDARIRSGVVRAFCVHGRRAAIHRR